MYISNVFVFCFLTHVVSISSKNVLGDGVSNVLGFYTGFRKLCLCRCGISKNYASHSKRDRSFSNDIYSTYEMPWLAAIHTGTTTIRGTLISDRHVITAANPLYRKSASEIVVTLGSQTCNEGSHALNTSIEAILIHPGYSGIVRNNDIALLRMRNPIQFSSFISPICMPLYETGKSDQLAWTASRLKNKSDLCLTRVVTLPILSSRTCRGNNTPFNSSVATLSDKGCLGPLGAKSILCENDVGGPVMTRWASTSPFRLAGIITNTSCKNDEPPLFTRTVDNMLWIHENIRKNCQCF